MRSGQREHPQGEAPQFVEKLIGINRGAKVHKGGKRLGFNALAVVGDGKGRVGMALGRSNEASDAIRKGFLQAQRNMVLIPLKGTTIPHEIMGKYDGTVVGLVFIPDFKNNSDVVTSLSRITLIGNRK